LKRVIAYSTCSQLGYMVFACGISQYPVAIFHLMNHAFFKALLFLSAGSVIHALSDEQDMRKMGGVVQLLPYTYGMMLIGSLSLVGFPFLTGFYSKDVILECAAAQYTSSSDFAYWLGLICVMLTSYYSFRLLFLTFLAPTSAYSSSIRKTHDTSLVMGIPLLLLAFGSLFVGFLAKDMMIGPGSDFWGNSLFVLPQHTILTESEYIPQLQKMLPLFFLSSGLVFAYIINYRSPSLSFSLKTSALGRRLYYMLNKRWFFDKVYNDFLAGNGLAFGYHVSFKTLDKGSFEILGPHGITQIFRRSTEQVSRIQSGMIYHYAVMMLLGLTLLITVVALSDFLDYFVDSRLYVLYINSFLLLEGLRNSIDTYR
jgi:NADH-ubiquinone oxidoreductase chain 5